MPVPELSRRIFLKRSLQSVAALAVWPAGVGCAPPGEAGRALSAGALGVLEAVAATFVPGGGPIGIGARDVALARRIDATLAEQDPRIADGARAALWLLEWGGGLVAGRFGRFSRLSPEDRAAVLSALPHRFGLACDVYAGLRTLCFFSFYSLDASWPATGYDGPWVGRGTAS